jgi:tripartite ATP-independent transporter DctM subunit
MVMEWYLAAVLVIGLLLVFMATGMPVAFAFLAVGAIGELIFIGPGGVAQIAPNLTSSITNFVFAPVPLFFMMGDLFYRLNLASRVFDSIDALLGRVPGRLSYVTVTSGTIFATLSGSSMGNTAMLGSLMIPEMTKRGYKKYMAMGPILGTGGLAILIPPSGLAVLLGSIAHIDIGKLLIAGALPGLILAALYVAVIFVQCRIDPDAAPQYEVEQHPLGYKVRMFLTNLLPMLLVIFMVIGLILFGLATPSESAAFGVLGVLILSLIYRTISWEGLVAALSGSLKVTAMLLIVVMASSIFSQLLAVSGATSGIVKAVSSVSLVPIVAVIVMFCILLLLGTLMDAVSMMLITVPIFFPVAISLGFDPIWFGVVVLLALEIGGITPPFGLSLFVMVAVAPKGTTLGEVARASVPYVACAIALFALLLLVPDLALFLPSLM